MFPGVLRSQNMYKWQLFYAIHSNLCKKCLLLLNIFKSDLFIILDCFGKCCSTARIYCSSFKFVRYRSINSTISGDRIDHLSTTQERWHLIQQFFLSVEYTDAHRCKHFVSGKNQKIHMKVHNIYRNMRNTLRSVCYKNCPLFVNCFRQFSDVICTSQNIGNLGNCYNFCPGCYGISKLIFCNRRIFFCTFNIL